ncbi:helix-turn-helix domain-containing protein [Sanguibacter suarezii]|uniref:helix-turn-helix domain-containing protein n=1 Tax=Sanguibacter suarezii TaxID=60921 RepID=UPI000A5972C3|nr:AraC family transcriptional regulator [Sanguibacter suarezii]
MHKINTPEFWHDSRFPQIESRRSCQQNSCYRLHTHDRFSIGLIDAGTSTFVGRSGSAVRLEPGDVIFIPAGHVHSCNPDDGEWIYQMIHLDPAWFGQTVLEAGSGPTQGIQVHRSPDLHRRFDTVNAMLFAGPTDLAEIERGLRSAFSELVAPLSQEHPPADEEVLAAALRPVLDVLADEAADPRLMSLARSVGMSQYQLIRAVKRATGLTPIAWRNDVRVTRARAMLRGGESITSVAYALGFADQSHFHRVFRSHVAATPGSYIR